MDVNGSSNKETSEAGLVLALSDGMELEYAIRFQFKHTNNEAEYEALIVPLAIAKELEVEVVTICSNSWLVVEQVLGEYEAKEDRMKRYLAKEWELKDHFRKFRNEQVPRAPNSRVD